MLLSDVATLPNGFVLFSARPTNKSSSNRRIAFKTVPFGGGITQRIGTAAIHIRLEHNALAPTYCLSPFDKLAAVHDPAFAFQCFS